MERHVLVRRVDSGASVVSEAVLPDEARLHAALAEHAELLPTAELDLGRCVVLGREVHLEAGRADLVLLDDRGQVAIVEVKNAGNPDVRRVVAQVLDYAASLWGAESARF